MREGLGERRRPGWFQAVAPGAWFAVLWGEVGGMRNPGRGPEPLGPRLTALRAVWARCPRPSQIPAGDRGTGNEETLVPVLVPQAPKQVCEVSQGEGTPCTLAASGTPHGVTL